MVTPLTPQVLSVLFPSTNSAAKHSDILPVHTFRFLYISQERLREEAQHDEPNLRKVLGHASIVGGVSKWLCIDKLPAVRKRSKLDPLRSHPCTVGKNEFYTYRATRDTSQEAGDHYAEEPISEEWIENRTTNLSVDQQTGSSANSDISDDPLDDGDSSTSDCCDDDFQSSESSADDNDSQASERSDDAEESKLVWLPRTMGLTDRDTGFAELPDQKSDSIIKPIDQNIPHPSERAEDTRRERGLKILLLAIATATSGAVHAYTATHSS